MNWLERFRSKSPSSGAVATARVKWMIETDRINIPPGALDEIRDQIVEIISRYITVLPDDVKVTLEEGDRIVARAAIGKPSRSVSGSAAAGAER